MEKKQTDAFRTTEYIDGFQYKTETGIAGGTIGLQFFATSEGYFDFVNNRYIYQYVDHLGNVRLSFTREGGEAITVEKADYYAFGLKYGGYAGDRSGANYNYEYNGKELQEETGMYDYGARFYMPDIGRWGVVDPLAETSRRFSPYVYGNNNPVRFIDPDGRSAETFTGQDAQNAYWHFYFGGSVSNFNGTYNLGSSGGNDNYLTSSLSYFDGGGSSGGGSLSPWMQNYLDGNDFTDVGAKDCCPDLPKSNKEITPFGLGVEWLSGTGARSRNFTNGDLMTEMLKKHSNVENAREQILYNVLHGQKLEGTQSYRLGGIKGVGLYIKDYSTLLTGGLTGNLAVTFLGSYDLNWSATPNYRNHTISVEFVVKNSSTMQSASRPPVLGYLPIWQNTAGKAINEKFEKGWGSKTTQTIIWTEILKMKKW